MKFKTKRLVILDEQEKETLRQAGKIIEQIRNTMKYDSDNIVSPLTKIIITNVDIDEDATYFYSDIARLDNLLYDLWVNYEIVTDTGEENGQEQDQS